MLTCVGPPDMIATGSASVMSGYCRQHGSEIPRPTEESSSWGAYGDDWGMRSWGNPNYHHNCEMWVTLHPQYKIVRGFLVVNDCIFNVFSPGWSVAESSEACPDPLISNYRGPSHHYCDGK
jgi:hypothetical protein